MKIIERSLGLILFFTVAFTMASCKVILTPYIPKIQTQISPKIINKTAKVEKFIDLSEHNKKNYLSIKPINNSKSAIKQFKDYNFENEITNAIVKEFSADGLFININKEVDNPNFILKGEIRKFSLTYH